jgi:glycosyltransferase involved in cell wall biosynthesis
MPPKPFFIKNIKSSTPRIAIPEQRVTVYTPMQLPSAKTTKTIPSKIISSSVPVPTPTLVNQPNKLTIITPSYRQQNIPMLYESIQFDKIDKWIIVYDTSEDRSYSVLYDGHPQIVEVGCDEGISGNPQRNYGMSMIDDGFIYFLDDDNIIHPNFWSIVAQLDTKHFYTFDQQRTATTILYGNDIRPNCIDTAMFIVHKQHIKHITFINDLYNADGFFISHIHSYNYGAHIYLNTIGCYYNFINPT